MAISQPANFISDKGVTIQSYDDIVTEIVEGTVSAGSQPAYPGLKAIYGESINVDPNSPDGQMVGIVALAKRDLLEFVQQVYNSFDPDQAVGVALDQRCAINGVQRKSGSYSYVEVDVTVTQALTLNGLDLSPASPFTVTDSNGNKFYLEASHAFSVAGTVSLSFRAAELGVITVLPNTLTTIATVTLGVSAVNNPSVNYSTGTNQETDAALRVRRRNSVALPSKGFLDGLYGGLLSLPYVTEALVLENVTNVTDANGIPGHSIWVIVKGGVAADIAQMIYVKRNAGCGMKGSVTVPVEQADGTTFDILFDYPTLEDVWVSFDVEQLTGTVPPDEDYIRSQILYLQKYGINQPADTTSLIELVRSIDSNTIVTNMQVSLDGSTWTDDKVSPTTVDKAFTLAPAQVIINGTPGT